MSVSLSNVGYMQVSDTTTGFVNLKKQFTSLLTTGTVFVEGQSITAATGGGTTVTLPVSPVQFLYVKNLHATATLTVTWTPTSGFNAVVQLLEPGGWLMFGQASPAAGSGITALNLIGSAACTCEYVIGG
jgi:hypothetical protein